MLLYCVLITKDLEVLLGTAQVGKPTKEGQVGGRKRGHSPMENQGPLPAFFCLWTRGTVF